MTFKSWLNNKKTSVSNKEFAIMLGLSEFMTDRLLSGEATPTTNDIIRFWITFRLNNDELLELIKVVADTYELSPMFVFKKVAEEVVYLTEQSENKIISLKRHISL